MKKIIPLVLLFALQFVTMVVTCCAQSPITLTNSGYTTIGTDTSAYAYGFGPFPSLGTPASNAIWDLNAANYPDSIFSGYKYVRKALPGSGNPFPAASYCYLYADGFPNNVLAYYMSNRYVQNNASGIIYLGEQVTVQNTMPLYTVTGNGSDSISFPIQTLTYGPAYYRIKFPATMGSTWRAPNTKWTAKFNVTVMDSAIINAPCERRATRNVSDSVVGWGKMRVRLADGSLSAYIPVLQVHETESVTDSFYLGNRPMATWLLSLLGMFQGYSTLRYYTLFYRMGEVRPLVEVGHTDTSFVGPTDYVLIQQNRVTPSSVATIPGIGEVKIYPNPVVSGDKLNILIPGNRNVSWRYALSNALGQVVADEPLLLNTSTQIALPSGLSSGIYQLRLSCGSAVVMMPVIVQ